MTALGLKTSRYGIHSQINARSVGKPVTMFLKIQRVENEILA